jgi:hypothetical protein
MKEHSNPRIEANTVQQRYFLDVPIYRISEKEFRNSYDRYCASVAKRFNWPPPLTPDVEAHRDELLRCKFGAPWQFNQIVGWARLYVLGTQIRADLWLYSAKHYVANPQRKRFKWVGKLLEIDAGSFDSGIALVSSLRKRLVHEVSQLHTGVFIPDLEVFDNIVVCIDWRKLLTGSAY